MINNYIQWRGKLETNYWLIPLFIIIVPYLVLLILPNQTPDVMFDFTLNFIVFENTFLAALNYCILVYVYFTLINFILQKFNVSWLTSGGWKLGIDISIVLSIPSFLIGALLPVDWIYIYYVIFVIIFFLWSWKFSK